MSIAEQSIIRALRRRLARSVVIKDAAAFEALYGQLQTAMTNAWSEAMREGIAQALDRLRDLGPGAFTTADAAMILRIAEGSVGPAAITAAMKEPVVNLTDALFRLGAEEVGKAANVAIAFMRPDLDALDAIKQGNLFWVGESWNSHTRKKLDTILTEYFTEGMTREGLAQRIAEDFATVTGKSEVYFEMLADHIATKGREIGRVTGYERAGIKRVQVRAQMDVRTSDICKSMHGRIIEVAAMRKQADDYIKAANRNDVEAVKRIWTMHGAKSDLSQTPTSALQGTASPPYHYRCRTITVAYFGASDGLAQLSQTITDREPVSREQIALVRDRVASADWMEEANARRHWKKHGGRLPVRKLDAYEASARATITDPAARLRLSMRVPATDRDSAGFQAQPYATFAVPAQFTPPGGNKRQGMDGHRIVSIRLDTNEIVTHHWRDDDLTSKNDIVPARDVLKAVIKRMMKWLIG